MNGKRKRPITQPTTASQIPSKTFWKKMTTLNKVMTIVTALALAQALFCFIYGLHYFTLGDLGESSVLWLFGVALSLSAVKAGGQIERNADEQSKE